MRKRLIFTSLCLAGHAGYAQSSLPKGTVQLGGISYSQQHWEDATYGSSITDYYTFGVAPQVGYFVAPGWVLGLGLNYGAVKQRYATTGTAYYNTQQSRSYQIGPFVQRYQMFTDQFGLTGTLGAFYAHGSSDNQGYNSTDYYTGHGSGNSLSATLTPGLVYLPVRRLALSASLGSLSYGYGRGTQRNSDGSTRDTKSSSFGTFFGLSYLTLSGTYFFRRD